MCKWNCFHDTYISEGNHKANTLSRSQDAIWSRSGSAMRVIVGEDRWTLQSRKNRYLLSDSHRIVLGSPLHMLLHYLFRRRMKMVALNEELL